MSNLPSRPLATPARALRVVDMAVCLGGGALGLFAIEAGASRDINLVYDLPSDLVDRRGNDIDYNLLIHKQPGIRRREVSVEFILPSGFRLASSSAEPVFAGDSRVGFRLQIKRDTVLSTQFTRRNEDAK